MIFSLPLCKLFKHKSNKVHFDIWVIPFRIKWYLNSSGSLAWLIRLPSLMMFSCNSGFKDKILAFADTVWIVFIGRYSSRRHSICATLQMILVPSYKSFGDKYGKCVVLFMRRFLFTKFILSFIIHVVCLTNLFQEE